MQKSLQLLFDPIQQHHLPTLQQIPCSIQCELFLIPEEGSQVSTTLPLEDKKFYLKKVYLQLRQPFIVQLDSQKQVFKSAIKNSLNLKLQIFKQLSLPSSEYSTKWFRLTLTHKLKKSMTFTAKKEQNIQQFIQRIIRIPLLQQGYEKDIHYEPIRKIGKGAHAKVFSIFDLIFKKIMAVRCFNLSRVQTNGKFKDSFIEEINILQLINTTVQNSAFFNKLQAMYESQNSFYMIIQLLERDLRAHISKFDFPSFPICKKLMHNLAKAINTLHKLGIMHRDIKLQNIMLRQGSAHTTIPVIVDFGIARRGNAPADSLPCGTPGYIAPQIYSGQQYNSKCDVFSLGVVYHYLLLGDSVFAGTSQKEISNLNQKCDIDYEFKRHPVITPEIRSLLSSMLRKQPENRLSSQEVVDHVFFRDIE